MAEQDGGAGLGLGCCWHGAALRGIRMDTQRPASQVEQRSQRALLLSLILQCIMHVKEGLCVF